MKRLGTHMSIEAPTVRLLGTYCPYISTFQATATVFCMALPVAMAENEFDAGWAQSKNLC
jgi:hypothetical protein